MSNWIITEESYKTLRDEFAMAAMTGLTVGAIDSGNKFNDYATWAYKVADAMMKAREKSHE